jgi:hypothetical protein
MTIVADVTRANIEDYKMWLAAQPDSRSPPLQTSRSPRTVPGVGSPWPAA